MEIAKIQPILEQSSQFKVIWLFVDSLSKSFDPYTNLFSPEYQSGMKKGKKAY